MHHQRRDAQMMYCSRTSLERHPSHDILLHLTIGTPPVMYGWKTQSLSHETPQGLDKLRVLFFFFLETGFVLYLLLFLQISQLDWDNWGTRNTVCFLHFTTGTATACATGRSLPAQPETITCPRLLTDDYFYPWADSVKVSARPLSRSTSRDIYFGTKELVVFSCWP